MKVREHRLRFAAVSALVVLALTGFSTGRGPKSGDDDGGGCSSSQQDHDSSSTSGGTSGSGGSSSGSGAAEPATVELVSCASKDTPYATVEVTNPNNRTYSFDISVTFVGKDNKPLKVVRQLTSVPANGTATAQVASGGGTVDHCEVEPTARQER